MNDRNINYRIVASSNARYYLKNHFFVKRSQYIRIQNPLHKQSEKACMCFKTRRVRTRDFTVVEIGPNIDILTVNSPLIVN